MDGGCEEETLSCRVPLMGKAKILLRPNIIKNEAPSGVLEYILSVGADNEKDLGFLCNKLSPLLDRENLSIHPLREKVAEYFNSLPPDPGCLARSSEYEKVLNEIIGEVNLKELEANGFVVLDSKMMTTPLVARNLSELLVEKTGQSKSTRSDTVTFLTEQNAIDCGLVDQFRILMSIASYLNENLDFEESEFEPLSPGTVSRPLTNPLEIQAAEYEEGEYYTEHR